MGVDRRSLVVAIDGPSGAGKSTIARGVADALGLRYLDTGASYRAVTWWVLHQQIDTDDAGLVVTAASAVAGALEISTDPARRSVVAMGQDVTEAIRNADVTHAVSGVSALPGVRAVLVAFQRAVIGPGGIVVEGRDIGTVVAPSAPVKVYLTADDHERASRRSRELLIPVVTAPGDPAPAAVDVAAVQAELDRRDRLDSGRRAAPLTPAADAVVLDSTGRTVAEVTGAVLAMVEERTGVAPLTAGTPGAGDPTGTGRQ